MLFSERSIWTMIHGVGFGGAALLTLAGAMTAMYLLHVGHESSAAPNTIYRGASAAVAKLTGLTALMLWLTSLVGTYIVFPPYRATPPEGTVPLDDYPPIVTARQSGDRLASWVRYGNEGASSMDRRHAGDRSSVRRLAASNDALP